MVDFATLDIRIDSTEVDTGVAKLDALAAAGGKTESAVGRLDTTMQGASRSTKTASAAAADYASKAQATAAAAMGAGGNIGKMGSASRLSANQVQNLTFQLNDMFVGLASGQRPATVFMQQGAQIGQIAQQAGLGVAGFARALLGLAGAATLALVTNPVFLAIAAAVTLAYGAFKLFQSQVAKTGEIDKFTASLGLTKDELKELEGVGVTAGDVMRGLWQTIDEGLGVSETFSAIKDFAVDAFTAILGAGKIAVAGIYAGFVGSYNGIVNTWSMLPSVMGELAVGAANAVITGLEFMVNKAISGINALASGANSVLEMLGADRRIGLISDVSFGRIENTYAGAGAKAGATFADASKSAFNDAMGGMDALGNAWSNNTLDITKGRLTKDADKMIDDRPDTASQAAKDKAKALSDQEKAYNAAVKAASAYADSLDQETAKIGKNAIELKNMEIASALAALAKVNQTDKTEELRKAIIKEGLAWELATRLQANADFQTSTIDPLKTEIALLGLVGTARDRAALALEETAFKADAVKRGLTDANAAWAEYLGLQTKLIDFKAADEAATAQLEAYLSMLDEAAAITDKAAQGMADAFGRVGDAIGRLASTFASYTADREASQQRINKLEKEPIKDMAAIAGARAAQKAMDLDYYRNVASGAKAFFKEGSDGYKALAAAEKALAVIQLVNTARSVAAGAAKMFATLGPFAFPAVAAMLAVMAGLGFAGGSGGTSARIPSAEELQEAAGTGSVLGDSKAKSSSISRSLEIMSRNSNRDLEYSNQMVRSLRAIETGIGSLASALAKELSIPGGAFDTSSFGLGSKTSLGLLGNGAILAGFGAVGLLLKQLPVIGGIITGIAKALFGTKTTRTLLDQGLNFDPQTIADIANKGFTGSTYSDIETKKKKKFFGISTGTTSRIDSVTGDLDSGLERQVGLLIGSLRSGIVEAAGILGIEGAGAALDAFTVNIGKISLKDLSGTEIQEQLEAVFSKLGDDMAAAAIPGIDAFQKVGEGLFKTLARLAKDYVTIDTALKSVGMTFGAVGASSVAAREGLIDLFGSLDDFVEQTSFFRDNFLTEAERIAPIASALRDELARLGLSGITTKDQFKAAVLGIDLTNEAGRSLYASLLNIAPAFSTVSDYVTGLNNTMRDSFAETVKQFTAYADSLRKYRDTLFQSESGSVNAYIIARARFANVAGLAANGNGDALGQLEGVSRTFLDRSRDNATSFLQYQRDMAAVANAVDAGIFAAESTADYAQLQLDALTNVVGLLSNIDTNIASVVSAPAVLTSTGVVTVGSGESNAELLEEIKALRAENSALTLKVVENSSATLRIWERMEGDGLAVRGVEGGDTPLQVQVTA